LGVSPLFPKFFARVFRKKPFFLRGKGVFWELTKLFPYLGKSPRFWGLGFLKKPLSPYLFSPKRGGFWERVLGFKILTPREFWGVGLKGLTLFWEKRGMFLGYLSTQNPLL